jgi:TolB-like protein
MKTVFVLLLLALCAGIGFAQNALPLNETVEEVANYLDQRIPAGTSVAVFNFSADSKKLSDYLVDELTIALANTGMDVYDRNNLNEVNREIYYGFTGAVDDDTAQAYGHDIGVQTVVLGSITSSGNNVYRLRIQAIIVETKKIQAASTFNVAQDDQLLALLDITIQKQYRFTSEEKTQAGFRNMLFGRGSFKMGDPLGGGITLAGEAVSVGLIFVGALIVGAADAPADSLEKERQPGYNCMIMGGVGLALSWTWGFVRPFLYDRPVAVQKAAALLDHVNIGLLPAENGAVAVNLKVQYSF